MKSQLAKMKPSVSKSSRRKFLAFSFLSGAGILTEKAQAMIPAEEPGETIPMLTSEGKLVEVPRHLLDQTADKIKVRNKEILDWSESAKKSSGK